MKKNRRPKYRVKCHRAMEGQEYHSICGLKNLGGFDGVAGLTTFDWKKVNCRKCLDLKHNYVT